MSKKLHSNASIILFKRAVQLRKQQTDAEEILWGYLRTKPFGYKFRRQHPYSLYILDFYCHSLKLVIEVDGLIHNRKEVQLNDKIREDILNQDGMTILRINNEEIFIALEKVIAKIEFQIKELSNTITPL